MSNEQTQIKIAKCQHINTKGKNSGKPCGKDVEENTPLCKLHNEMEQAAKQKAKIIGLKEVRKSNEIFDKETVETLLKSVYFHSDNEDRQKQLNIELFQLKRYYGKAKDEGNQLNNTVFYDRKEYGRYISRIGRADAHCLKWTCMSMPSFIRNVLFSERYDDYDLANAHIVISFYTFKAFNLESPLTEQMADDQIRTEIINQIMIQGQVTRKIAKRLPLRIFYGGEPDFWFEENFAHEMDRTGWANLKTEVHNNIVVLLENQLKEYLLYAKRMNLDIWNKEQCKIRGKKYRDIYAVAWAHYCQDIERRVITYLWDQAIADGLQIGGVIHDGFHASKTYSHEYVRETLFKKWEQGIIEFTKKDMGYEIPLKLEIKTMEYDKALLAPYVPPKDEIAYEETYEGIKEQFEKDHFLVSDLAEYCVLQGGGRYLLKNKSKMRDTYEHMEYKDEQYSKEKESMEIVNKKFIDRWFKDPTKRQHKEIGLYPPPSVKPEGAYNLWQGWEIEKHQSGSTTEEECKAGVEFIKSHYKFIAGETGYEYLIKHHAVIAKKPAFKNGKMITYQSDVEGVGKSSLYEINKAWMGMQYCVKIKDADQELLNGFNALTKHKIYIFLEEFDGNDGKGKAGRKLMEMITSSEDNITHKGKDTFQTMSVSHYEASTNVLDAKKISDKNRRDVFIRIEADCKPASYYDQLYKYIGNKDVMKAWYNFLLKEDVEGYDWTANRPNGEYFEDLKEASRDLEFQHLITFITDRAQKCAQTGEWVEKFTTSDLHDIFKKHLEDKKIKYDTTSTKYGIKLLKYKKYFTSKGKSKGITTYTIDYFDAVKTLISEKVCYDQDFDFLQKEDRKRRLYAEKLALSKSLEERKHLTDEQHDFYIKQDERMELLAQQVKERQIQEEIRQERLKIEMAQQEKELQARKEKEQAELLAKNHQKQIEEQCKNCVICQKREESRLTNTLHKTDCTKPDNHKHYNAGTNFDGTLIRYCSDCHKYVETD